MNENTARHPATRLMRRFALWPTVIGVGTALVVALFLLIAVRNVSEMRVLRDETYRIERTLEVQRELDAVLLAQSEADADVRAYLLTAAPPSLASLRADQQVAVARLETLRGLIADNPEQLDRLTRLRAAIDERRARLDLVVRARENGSIEAAVAQGRAADAGAPRDTLRSIISELESHETALLATRRQRASLAYQRAVNGRVGSSLVSAALLIAVVITAALHARSKARREAALVQSEQRAREAAAREQQARGDAERANREKDQFLAVLSHELRTPLNAVLGWTQILQAAGQDEATITRALASIRRNAEAQQRLVEDLLDVSRIIAGKLPFEREPFSLRLAIGAAVESVRPAAHGKELTLDCDLGDTPLAMGDAGRIQQVAWNLLTNAVKFTPSGGHISVRLHDAGASAVIEVIDTGMGLSSDLRPHVFERFRQGDSSTTRAFGGLGLGLAIAKHIVEAHGGTIAAESEGVDRGATFRVQLPYS
jgi:signal transduction histidine kinase